MKSSLCFVVLVAAAAQTSLAFADPTTQDRALAESLFRDGKNLIAHGKVAEACPKFAESQRLDPQIGTLLYVATCDEQQGKTSSAWADFSEAADLASRAHQPDREQIARSRADALEKKLTKLTITVAKPKDDLEVRLDGHLVGRASWGTALPVDPGAHKVEATEPKHAAWSSDMNAPAGPATIAVEVPELTESAPVVAAVVPQNGDATSTPGNPPSDTAKEDHSGKHTAGLVIGGVGVAGLAVGIVFGLVATSNKSSADNLAQSGACVGSACTQPALDKYSSARSAANIATVGFAAGIVGVGLGTYLVLTSKSSDASAPTAWLAPTALPGGGGASGGFRF